MRALGSYKRLKEKWQAPTVIENLKWERTTNYICICDAMWLGEKRNKDSPVQFYGVHTETLLHGTDTKQSGQKTISLKYCIYLGIAALEKVWTNRENLIQVCLTHDLKKLNPKSNTGTCLAPNSAKVHTMYACFRVYLWSHWDLSYRRGQICIAVRC